MHGALTKRGPFARNLGANFADGMDEPYVVSVMPCTAKKDEAARPGAALMKTQTCKPCMPPNWAPQIRPRRMPCCTPTTPHGTPSACC